MRSLGCVATRASGNRRFSIDSFTEESDGPSLVPGDVASPEERSDENPPSSPASALAVSRDISMDAKLGFAPLPFARGGFACHDPEATHVPKRGEKRGVVKKRKAARRGFPTPPGAFRRAREVSSRARFHEIGGRATPHVRGRHVVIAGEGPEASRVATASVARPRMIGASRADSDAKIAFRAPSSAPSNRFVAAEKRPANLTLENFFWREPEASRGSVFLRFFPADVRPFARTPPRARPPTRSRRTRL